MQGIGAGDGTAATAVTVLSYPSVGVMVVMAPASEAVLGKGLGVA